MKPIITFDMDQTLISSNLAHISAYRFMLKKLKIRKQNVNWKEIIRLKTRDEAVKKLCPWFNEKQVKKGVKIYLNYLEHISYKKVRKKKYVTETLKALKLKYRIAVITNCRKESAAIMLEKGAGIPLKYFDIILGSEDVKNVKPSPEIIKLVEKKLQGKVIVHIGDSTNDIKAARAAGVKVIAVATGNHTRRELKRLKPDYLVGDLRDVIGIVKS